MHVTLDAVPVDKPGDVNVIVGQAHFIKTVEDLHEALAAAGPHLRFGLAFCEASGDRLIRRSGNDDALAALAVSVLNQVKAVPEVCSVYCATANQVQVLVAVTEAGRGVIGVVDGLPPAGVEADADVARRHRLLRDLGYKL